MYLHNARLAHARSYEISRLVIVEQSFIITQVQQNLKSRSSKNRHYLNKVTKRYVGYF